MSQHATPCAVVPLVLRDPDVLAGACSFVCLAGLVALRALLGAMVTISLLTYAGLRLIGMNEIISQVGIRAVRRLRRKSEVNACERLARNLHSRVGEADDREIAVRLRTILDCTDRCLVVMQEDQSEEAAGRLLPLIDTTNQILAAYLRLTRRDLASEELRAAFLSNLETLEAAFDSVWILLNREAIVALGTLSAMIEIDTSTNLLGPMPPARRRSLANVLANVSIQSGRQ